ncbi:MAG: hypothetical protein M1836_002365 [Candelina mexicana]|nr:MAG: hypothetical protein M1836_002365 [Candelina mexicana]
MENLCYSDLNTPAKPCDVNHSPVAQYPVNPGMEFDEFGALPAPIKRVGRDESGEEAQLDRNGRRFLSPIFSVLVGPEKILMTAHKEVLCQSPVLRCMCTGPFVESSAKALILSEDDPAIFTLLMEYLYSGTYDPKHSDLTTISSSDKNNGKSSDRMEEATDLYLLADKYALPHLQRIIICKLNHGEIHFTSQSFFASAKRIFTFFPTTTGPFFSFFRYKAGLLLNPLVVSSNWFAELFNEGGVFAVELGRFMGEMITGQYPIEIDANPKALWDVVMPSEVRAQTRREMRTPTRGQVGV